MAGCPSGCCPRPRSPFSRLERGDEPAIIRERLRFRLRLRQPARDERLDGLTVEVGEVQASVFADVNLQTSPVLRARAIAVRRLLRAGILRIVVFRRAIFHPLIFAARRHRLAGFIRLDERDVCIHLAVAAVVVDDGDDGVATDKALGVELVLLGLAERAPEPLAQEFCERRFFEEARREARAPHAERRAVLPQALGFKHEAELLARAEIRFDLLERCDVHAKCASGVFGMVLELSFLLDLHWMCCCVFRLRFGDLRPGKRGASRRRKPSSVGGELAC